MSPCCNSPGQCDHGPDCPAGPATLPSYAMLPKTCEQLGVCQHPLRECPGGCERVASGQFEAPSAPDASIRQDFFITALLYAATAGVTLGVVYGAVRFIVEGWAP